MTLSDNTTADLIARLRFATGDAVHYAGRIRDRVGECTPEQITQVANELAFAKWKIDCTLERLRAAAADPGRVRQPVQLQPRLTVVRDTYGAGGEAA